MGAAWADGDLVFCDEAGGPMLDSTVYMCRFVPLVMKIGLPVLRFHDSRHVCATVLLGRGVNPKIVSSMLGHSSVAITLDI